MIKFLIHANKLGMSDSKKYAFITVDYLHSDTWKNTILGNESNDFIKNTATHGLISIEASRPNTSDPVYIEFAEDVRRRIALPPFNNTSLKNTTTVSLY